MKCFYRHQRDVKPEFLFVEGGPEIAEAKPETTEKEGFVLEKDDVQELRSLAESEDQNMQALTDFVEQTFEKKYGIDAYRKSIRKWITAEIKGAKPEVIDRMVRDSVARYGETYRTAKAEFYKKVEQAIIKRKTIDNSISTAIGDSLSGAWEEVTELFAGKDDWPEKLVAIAKKEQKSIKSAVKKVKAAQEAVPKVGEKAVTKVEKTARDFTDFVEALNNQYTDIKRVRNQLTDKELSEYKKLVGGSDGFRQTTKEFTRRQIDSIFENAETPKELKTRLEEFRDYLVKRYEKISSKDGVIDLHEMRRIKREGRRYDLMQMIQGETDERLEAQMESIAMVNFENFQKAAKALSEKFIADAENYGSEAAFIDGVKEITGVAGALDFDTASDLFLKTMASKTTVKETLATAKKFIEIANKDRIKKVGLNDIKPDSIKYLVTKERQLLLRRLTAPGNLDDQLVVEFMSTNREGRNRMLSHPKARQKLYQAIQNIKEYYPKIYKQYKQGIPRKISQLKTGYDIEHPTRHDKAARLLALVSIAKESEWVIKNLDRSDDYKQISMTEELENTNAESVPPPMDLKFGDVHKKTPLRYVSKLGRGGFNGKDLFLGAAKIWAVATITINVFSALTAAWKKSTDKETETTFLGNIADFAGKAATNPYILGGGAAFYAIGKYQKRPELAGIVTGDPGKREKLLTINTMDGLHKKLTTRDLMGFVHNENEWRAMEAVMDQPKQGVNKLKRLREKARRNNRAYPGISKAELRDVVDNDAIWSQLPDRGNERTRYLFYEAMLSKPRNMRTLKKNCQSWTT